MRLVNVLLLGMLAFLPPEVRTAPAPTTIVLVRHAEKAKDDERDPSLSSVGQQRAMLLAKRLSAAAITAIYATPYRRTQQTAAPSAYRHELPITLRAASEPATAFADMLRARHPGETVLVVGHSNTIPALVEALSDQAVKPIAEHEYHYLFVVTLGTGDVTQLRIESSHFELSPD